MRGLEFRVWDKKEKKYLETARKFGFHLNSNGYLEVSSGWNSYKEPVFAEETVQSRYIVEFYIGKKNKNGKKIFAGDIIEVPLVKVKGKQTSFERWVVREIGEWHCTCGDYYCSESGIGFSVEGYSGYCRENGKIDKENLTCSILRISDKCVTIGNKSQNPELLEDLIGI